MNISSLRTLRSLKSSPLPLRRTITSTSSSSFLIPQIPIQKPSLARPRSLIALLYSSTYSTQNQHRVSTPTSSTVTTGSRTYATNASSQRWLARQTSDPYTKQAKIDQMKGRAGIKLVQMNIKHKFLGKGMTVVDLGFAPGAWTEVAVSATSPNGCVIGVDILPATPPTGASTFQGDFLDEKVQMSIKRFLSSHPRGKTQSHFIGGHGYLEAERAREESIAGVDVNSNVGKETVDLVISDMWEPWNMFAGHWVNSIKLPYHRLMNVSGIRFKDHVDSMDLCVSALLFSIDVLKPKGSFICKIYSGKYDKEFERALKASFEFVEREKPDSSRKESREGYYIAKRLRPGLDKNAILNLMPHLQ